MYSFLKAFLVLIKIGNLTEKQPKIRWQENSTKRKISKKIK